MPQVVRVGRLAQALPKSPPRERSHPRPTNPGTRRTPMSTTSPHAHVPQLRLPGQAAAPEGPVDMTMMYLMHHAFRRDLSLFATTVPRTPVEDRRAWRALEERWAL